MTLASTNAHSLSLLYLTTLSIIMSMSNASAEDAFVEGLARSIERFKALGEQRKQTEGEMAKMRQYMSATLDLLDGDLREAWESIVDSIVEGSDAIASSTLTEAIKRTLNVNFPDWLTVANVRDQLVASGFDFSSYKSNELASVSTTLRRMKDETEVRQTNGTNEYRLAPPNFSMHAGTATQLRDALKRMGSNVQIDPNRLPPEVAGAIYGGTSTDSPQNQPAPHTPSNGPKSKTLGQHIAAARDKGERGR